MYPACTRPAQAMLSAECSNACRFLQTWRVPSRPRHWSALHASRRAGGLSGSPPRHCLLSLFVPLRRSRNLLKRAVSQTPCSRCHVPSGAEAGQRRETGAGGAAAPAAAAARHDVVRGERRGGRLLGATGRRVLGCGLGSAGAQAHVEQRFQSMKNDQLCVPAAVPTASNADVRHAGQHPAHACTPSHIIHPALIQSCRHCLPEQPPGGGPARRGGAGGGASSAGGGGPAGRVPRLPLPPGHAAHADQVHAVAARRGRRWDRAAYAPAGGWCAAVGGGGL